MKTATLLLLIYATARAGHYQVALVLALPLVWIVARGRGLASTGPSTIRVGVERCRKGNQPLVLVLVFAAVVVGSTIARAS